VGSKFIQHNPLAADGKEAFVAFVTWWTAQVPQLKFDFKRVFGENDLVLVHHKRTLSPTDRGSGWHRDRRGARAPLRGRAIRWSGAPACR